MSDELNFDMGEAADASPVSIKKVVKLATAARDLETRIAELEELTKGAKARLNQLRHFSIPDAMAELQISEFSLEDGTKVTADDFVGGSLPKEQDKREEAIEWLASNGASGLIKTEVSMNFSKSEFKKAERLFKQLTKAGHPATLESTVHPQSLMAFGRERLRNGEATPWEKLGLFAGRVAKFKIPRGGKG